MPYSRAVRQAMSEPPGLGYDCPICGEYQCDDELRYHPATHDDKFKSFHLSDLEDVYSFYLDCNIDDTCPECNGYGYIRIFGAPPCPKCKGVK